MRPGGAFACRWIVVNYFQDDTGGFTKRGECVATCMFLFETLSPTAKKEMVPLWAVVSRNLTLSRNPHWVRTERLLPFGLSCSNVRNATAISIATHIPFRMICTGRVICGVALWVLFEVFVRVSYKVIVNEFQLDCSVCRMRWMRLPQWGGVGWSSMNLSWCSWTRRENNCPWRACS